MNSKLLLLTLFLVSSCGVKSPPLAPIGTETPSYEQKYIHLNSVDKAKKKNNEQPDSSNR